MKQTALFTTTALAGALGLLVPLKAGAEDRQPIDIPAQPLADAITELGTETGLQIAANGDAIADLTSSGVQGPMTPMEALRQLVSGTSLSVRAIGEDSAVVAPNRFVSQNATQQPLELGTIVVTGELIDRNIQETQTSVIVLSGEELEQKGDLNFENVVENNPGVNVGGGGTDIVIRGINGRGPTGFGGRTINTSIDGARISDIADANTNNFSTWDVEQVEILRGPQSTQTGRNALAGAVNVRSNNPVFFDEYKFRLGAGNGNTREGAFVLNTPLVDNRLAFRLAADRFRTDGFATNPNQPGAHPQQSEQTTVRASLRWDPTNDFSAILKYTYIDEDGGLEPVSAAPFPPDRLVFDDFPSERNLRLNSYNLRLGYQINDNLRFESSTTHFDSTSYFSFDQDRTQFPAGFGTRENDVRSTEQEFRLLYETDRLTAVGGVFYLDLDRDFESAGVFNTSFLPVSPPGVPRGALIQGTITGSGKLRNYAVFGEVDYQIRDNLRVIAGLRYDVSEQDSSNRSERFILGFGPNPIPLPVGPPTNNSTKYSVLLPKLGLVYDLTEDQSIGFTYQRGYRAGGSGTNVFTLNPYTFDPEFTDNFELAYRSEWYDGNLVFNANAFYTYWTEQQVTRQLSPNPSDNIIENAGKSRIWGGELDIRAMATPDLELFAGVAYANTEFLEYDSDGLNLAGNQFLYAPNWTANLGANYFLGDGWRIGGNVAYTGSTFSDVENSTDQKNEAYWLANASVSKTLSNGVEIVGYVNNLFDEEYTFFRSSPGPNATVTPGAPRTFGLFAQATF